MAMPYPVEPMLAVSGTLPVDRSRFVVEVKWDGIRAIVYTGDDVRITGRRGTDFTHRYPEVAAIGAALGGRRAILDGELVAFDSQGHPSFELLQRRMHVENPAATGLTTVVPVSYVPFDLIFLDGHTLFDLPYRNRRELLDTLGLNVPPYFSCDPAVLEATRRQGLEGVVAKRLDSPYRPGRRTDLWVKVKNVDTTDVVVGGWRPGKGRRAGGVGSLLLGMYGGTTATGDVFHYVGHVGTGFTDAALDDLYRVLKGLETERGAFSAALPREIVKDARWVRPELVGEVAYTMWTLEGRLRNPVWRGLRPDVIPAEVRKEHL